MIVAVVRFVFSLQRIVFNYQHHWPHISGVRLHVAFRTLLLPVAAHVRVHWSDARAMLAMSSAIFDATNSAREVAIAETCGSDEPHQGCA